MSEFKVGDRVICGAVGCDPGRRGYILDLYDHPIHGRCAEVMVQVVGDNFGSYVRAQYRIDHIRRDDTADYPAVPSPLNQPPLPPVDVSYVAPHYDPPRKYSPQLSGWRYVVAYAWECGAAIVNLFRGSHKDDRRPH